MNEREQVGVNVYQINNNLICLADEVNSVITKLTNENKALLKSLENAVEKLKKEKIVGHITLIKGERSQLADMAAKYF